MRAALTLLFILFTVTQFAKRAWQARDKSVAPVAAAKFATIHRLEKEME
jgi:hypothetical protein